MIDELFHSNGRIKFVEPNDVFGYGDNDKKIPLTPPYEDMCVAFNLIVEKYNRFDVNDRKIYHFHWRDKMTDGSTNGSFLDGRLVDNDGNSYLSTYYTDISSSSYKQGEMIEGLGVESIQVSHDSWYAPTVTIKFVDVRGSALFGREEAIHTDSTASGKINADNFFGALFTQPYPKFRLQVKGFFGKDVTYQLTVSNFTADFDDKTGNFIATVTFVGYTWSILTDIPLVYLIAAPYCNYKGQDYWNEHVTDPEWQLNNSSLTMVTDTKPQTLVDLFNKIQNCIKEGPTVLNNKDNEQGEIETILNNLKDLINSFNIAVNHQKGSGCTLDNSRYEQSLGIFKEIQACIEQLSQSVVIDTSTINPSCGIEKEEKTVTDENGEEKVETTYKIADLSKLSASVQSEINNVIETTNKIIEQNNRDFVINSLKEINFDPNIYNIFKLLMCHLETLMYIFFEANNEIEEQRRNNERTPKALGVSLTATDIPRRFTNDFNLPAWTGVFNEDGVNVNDNDKIEYQSQLKWVGSLKGGNNKWVEERVVWSLQNAMQNIKPSDNGDSNISNIYGRRDSVIPSLPNDITQNVNEFSKLSNVSFDNLCGNLGIRMTQLFGIMDKTLSSNPTLVKAIGELDAYNYFLICSTTDDIKSKILEKIDNGNAADIMSGIMCCDNNYINYATLLKNGNTDRRFIFENECVNEDGRQPIFKKNNNSYDYVYFNDKDGNNIVPSEMFDFTNDYTKIATIDETNSKQNDIVFNGVVKDDNNQKVVNSWLYSNDSQTKEIVNKEMFNIIDDKGIIDYIENWYNKLKEDKVKIKGYTAEKNYSDFIERYWKVSFDDYNYTTDAWYYAARLGLPAEKNGYYDGIQKPQKHYVTKDKNIVFRSWRGTADSLKFENGKNYNELHCNENNNYYDINKDIVMKSVTLFYNDGNKTLFGHPIYYMQNQKRTWEDEKTAKERSLYAKAYLLLESIPKNNHTFNNLKSHGGYIMTNKVNLLYIGGLLYRQQYYNDYGEDLIQYKSSNGEIKYKECINRTSKRVLTMSDDVDASSCQIYKDELSTNCVDIDTYLGCSLSSNIQQQLIDYFKKFVTGVSSGFITFDSYCSLYKTSNGKSFDNADEFMNEIIKPLSNTLKNVDVTYFNSSYWATSVWDFMHINMENADPTMYLLFSEDMSDTKIKFVNNFLKDLSFSKVLMFSENKVPNDNKKITLSKNVVDNYLNSFVDTLRKIYENNTNEDTEYDTTGLTDNIEQEENQLLAIYLYCKTLWDKWLFPFTCKDDYDSERNEHYFEVKNFFKKHFVFIDSYYNDISTKLKVNLDVLYNSYIGRIESSTLFNFIGDIVGKHRCIFVGLPNYVSLGMGIKGEHAQGMNNLINMFKPVPFSEIGNPTNDNHFVVIYTYPPASKMPDEFSYRYDGFDIYSNDEDVTRLFEVANYDIDNSDDTLPTKYGYDIPAFSVAFAKQNNHLFKNIHLAMNNPVVTEQSIKTLTQVAEIAKGNNRKVCFVGQDIYSIYSNYSYQVDIEMMGDAQIQPLMYFQLMNIPMWRGAYMIFNVNHTMTPGNMVTRFKGMKMSKNPVPILSKYWSFVKTAYMDGLNPYNGDFSGWSEISEFRNLPDKRTASKDYFSENNWIGDYTKDTHQDIKSLFNDLFEEIMYIEGNGNGDINKMKWNIYCISGYRPGNSSDHSTGHTIDISIADWTNGKAKVRETWTSDKKELYTVLALIKKNHMDKFTDETKQHILIEYHGTDYFWNNKNTNSISMLHTSLGITPYNNKGIKGPFIVAINHLGKKKKANGEYEYGYGYATNHLSELGGAAKYVNCLHPSLLSLCATDYNRMNKEEFIKRWKGVIPADYYDKLSLSTNNVDGTMEEKIRKLYNIVRNLEGATRIGTIAIVANACRETRLKNTGTTKDANKTTTTNSGLWQWNSGGRGGDGLERGKKLSGKTNATSMWDFSWEIQAQVMKEQAVASYCTNNSSGRVGYDKNTTIWEKVNACTDTTMAADIFFDQWELAQLKYKSDNYEWIKTISAMKDLN